MYEKYNYTNLIYPHLAFGCNIASFSSVKFQAGPMYTDVQEDGDYFKDGSDHDALFARVELAWNF